MKSFAEPRLGLLMIVGAFSLFVGMVHLDAGAVAQDQPTAAANDKGQAALAAGREALAEGRWQEAINRFTEALGYLPGNEEALAGREAARAQLNQASTSEDVARTRKLQHDRAVAEFNESLSVAQERRKQGDFPGAGQEVALAMTRLDEFREFLSPSEYSDLRAKGSRLAEEIERERIAAELAAAEQAREDADIAKRREADRALQEDAELDVECVEG